MIEIAFIAVTCGMRCGVRRISRGSSSSDKFRQNGVG